MMKTILMFGLLILLSSSNYSQSTKFYEQAVSHLNCRNCYLIPITVESEVFSGKVVVDNYSLFSYLKAVRGYDEEIYKSFMVKLLQDNQPLPMKAVAIDEKGLFLQGKDMKEHSFRIVKTSPSFDEISAEGCKKIVQYYFSPELVESETNKGLSCRESIKLNAKSLFMKPRFDLTEQNNVISKLFEMEIPVYMDDISGSPKIGHLTLR